MYLSNLKKSAKLAHELGYKINQDGECENPQGKVLKASLSNSGYKNYSHSKGLFRAHQLAAYQKFGEKWLYSNLFVRHLDNNKLNNRLENIDIGTRQENVNDSLTPEYIDKCRTHLSNLKSSPSFELNRMKASRLRRAKCSDEKVLEILHFYYITKNKNVTLKETAELFKINDHDVSRIVNGNLYKDIYKSFWEKKLQNNKKCAHVQCSQDHCLIEANAEEFQKFSIILKENSIDDSKILKFNGVVLYLFPDGRYEIKES